MVELLLAHGGDVKCKTTRSGEVHQTALHICAAHGDPSSLSLLVGKGGDVNELDAEGRTPLHLAAEGGHAAVVEALLEAGANPAAAHPGRTALHVAAEKGFFPVCEALLKKNADVNVKVQEETRGAGMTALLLAAAHAHSGTAELLVHMGAEVRTGAAIGDIPNVTALHLACEGCSAATAALILDKNADPNALAAGKTPLHLAALAGALPMVTVLLQRGAAVRAKTIIGNSGRDDVDDATSLHLAAQRGHTEVVRALLAAGASVDDQDFLQKTALHLAAEQGHLPTVRLLLASGADAEMQTYGSTAVDLAKRAGHAAVVDALAQHLQGPCACLIL
mmetsp:Transcript_17732/g.43007  ORF Transcript_17732/g.43007 Transcript_17732/m.43007 type:complete len:335 (+) Transcript_17732:1474-2478(+)